MSSGRPRGGSLGPRTGGDVRWSTRPPGPTVHDPALRRLQERLRVRAYSHRTERTYLSWIQRYLRFHGGKSPAMLGRIQAEEFLRHLAEQGLAPRSRNLAASAIAFLYRELWGQELGGRAGLVRARSAKGLPRYVPPEDVERVFARLSGDTLLACMIMYGSGLRLSETLALRVQDLSLGTREITVRSGKGGRDRTTLIAARAVGPIRVRIGGVADKLRADREIGAGWAPLPHRLDLKDPEAGWTLGWQFLFPSPGLAEDPTTHRLGRHPLHTSTVQKHLKRAVRSVGLTRALTPHILRHSFATELVRRGVDVRLIQRLLGHRWLSTTMKYLHVVDRPGLAVESPLDRLTKDFGEGEGEG